MLPDPGNFAADPRRCGAVALMVFQDPIKSMSITVLKALCDTFRRGAKKIPAAPALLDVRQFPHSKIERGFLT